MLRMRIEEHGPLAAFRWRGGPGAHAVPACLWRVAEKGEAGAGLAVQSGAQGGGGAAARADREVVGARIDGGGSADGAGSQAGPGNIFFPVDACWFRRWRWVASARVSEGRHGVAR